MHIEFDNESEIISDIYTLADALEDILIFMPDAASPVSLCRLSRMLVRAIADGATELGA